MRVGILTISDRVSSGRMEDASGDAIERSLDAPNTQILRRDVVPDDEERIAAVLRAWADDDGLDLVLTTGGTGLGPRDVTPEATMSVATRMVPGVAEAIRAQSLAYTPLAMLSRGISCLRGSTLIVNLPGSPRGATESVGVILPVLEHAVAIIAGGSH